MHYCFSLSNAGCDIAYMYFYHLAYSISKREDIIIKFLKTFLSKSKWNKNLSYSRPQYMIAPWWLYVQHAGQRKVSITGFEPWYYLTHSVCVQNTWNRLACGPESTVVNVDQLSSFQVVNSREISLLGTWNLECLEI